MTIKIIVAGANGKMGKTTLDALANEKDLALVDVVNRGDDLSKSIRIHQADVVIDFTTPQSGYQNALAIIESDARPVIGTTGLTADNISTLKRLCDSKQLGGIVAPNFSVGAILMMRFAAEAMRFFPDVEIVEMHHPHKVDAPSGTAKKTAEMIAEHRKTKNTSHFIDSNLNAASRGNHCHDIPIHSIRMSGYFASQKIVFGNQGELFSIQHDALDRQAMMPGLFFCCREVMKMNHLLYGMENLLK